MKRMSIREFSIVYPQSIQPLFTVFPDLPGLPPFSHIFGFTLDLDYICPNLPCTLIYHAMFLSPKTPGKTGL